MSLSTLNKNAFARPDLGVVITEAMMDAPSLGFIGLAAMPIKFVNWQVDTYPVMPLELLFNLRDDSRGTEGNYNRVPKELFEEGYYSTKDRGIERVKDDREFRKYQSLFDYEMMLSKLNMMDILRAHESRVAKMLFNETNFDKNDVIELWSDPDSLPRNDVENGKDYLEDTYAIVPNSLILSSTAYRNLKFNSDVYKNIYQLSGDAQKTGKITIQHLRDYFEIENILIAGAPYNIKGLGQDAQLAKLWDSKYVMLCKISNDPNIAEPCIGRTIIWNEGGSTLGENQIIVEEYRDEGVRANILRNRWDVDNVLLCSFENNVIKSNVSKACGLLIDTTTKIV